MAQRSFSSPAKLPAKVVIWISHPASTNCECVAIGASNCDCDCVGRRSMLGMRSVASN